MKIRKTVSLTVFLSFVVLAGTGIMLFLSPQGRVAYWSGWTLLGLSKEQIGALHTTFMVLFLVGVVWHIVLNWKPIMSYLKNRSRKTRVFVPEFNLALVLTLLFFVGTLASVAPFETFLSAGEDVKSYWERQEGSPPWGHAEENTLERFTRGLVDWERLENQRLVRLSVEEGMSSLRTAGLSVESERQTLVDIAAANDTTPQRLMEIILQAARPREEASAVEMTMTAAQMFPQPMSGLGRMTLEDYCARYEIELEFALALFGANQVAVDPAARMKETAEILATDPEGVIALLNEWASE